MDNNHKAKSPTLSPSGAWFEIESAQGSVLLESHPYVSTESSLTRGYMAVLPDVAERLDKQSCPEGSKCSTVLHFRRLKLSDRPG
jgi:hypothetical protein